MARLLSKDIQFGWVGRLRRPQTTRFYSSVHSCLPNYSVVQIISNLIYQWYCEAFWVHYVSEVWIHLHRVERIIPIWKYNAGYLITSHTHKKYFLKPNLLVTLPQFPENHFPESHCHETTFPNFNFHEFSFFRSPSCSHFPEFACSRIRTCLISYCPNFHLPEFLIPEFQAFCIFFYLSISRSTVNFRCLWKFIMYWYLYTYIILMSVFFFAFSV